MMKNVTARHCANERLVQRDYRSSVGNAPHLLLCCFEQSSRGVGEDNLMTRGVRIYVAVAKLVNEKLRERIVGCVRRYALLVRGHGPDNRIEFSFAGRQLNRWAKARRADQASYDDELIPSW